MKKSIFVLLSVFIVFNGLNSKADNVIKEKATVSKATVYLRGAQLTCSADITTVPGLNQLIFEGVSPSLNPNSLQAAAKGNVVIMDVKYQLVYNEIPGKANPKPVDRSMKNMTDSLALLNYDIESLNEQMQSLQTEKNIILNNRLLKGESVRDTLDMFMEGISYLRTRLNNITLENLALKKNIFYKNELKTLLEKRIQELKKVNQVGETPKQVAVPTIVVLVFAEAITKSRVSVNFFVDQAAWLPVYDLRASANGTIDLNYKAELRQQTGMDWNNIDLTLSTANPALTTAKPVLTPFYLSFVQNHRRKFNNESLELLSKSAATSAVRETDEAKEDMLLDARTLAQYTEERDGMLQTEYDIKLKYSIPHDDQMHLVLIQGKSLKAHYLYSAVPKLDMNAFLMAEVYDLNELNLLPGNSRIYLDGSYVGKSVLNPDGFSDTLQLGLGKDRTLIVQRKKMKDKIKERMLADEKTISTTYELTIKNNKATAATLDISDQIPVSNDPAIKVELIDGDGAVLNPETGILNWKLSLKSMEAKKIRFTYEVKLPKSKALAGR